MLALLPALGLAAAFAAADPPSLSGDYRFEGRWELGAIKDEEVVYALSPDGRQHLELLRGLGWACENRGREAYLCWKWRDELLAPDWLGPRVEEGFRGFTVAFGETRDGAELVYEGVDYSEWRVRQALTVNGRRYPEHRYVISQGVHKVAAGEPAGDYFSAVVASRGGRPSLELAHSERHTQKQKFTHYYLSVILSR